jgi:hypothetical protein
VGKLPGLKDCKGICSMLGYPGANSLFGTPVSVPLKKDQDFMCTAAAAVAPTFLGCISETTGTH